MARTTGTDLDPSTTERPGVAGADSSGTGPRSDDPDSSGTGRPSDDPERYREQIANSPVGQATYGLDGELLEANAAWASMLGYEIGELVGTAAIDHVHPEQQGNQRQVVVRLLDGEIDHYRSEHQLVRKDGSLVWVASSITLERDADGEPRCFPCSVIDISEQKLALEALQQSEARYRDVVESLHEGLVIHTLDRIEAVNRSACELLGRTFDELAEPDVFAKLEPIGEDGRPIPLGEMVHLVSIRDRVPVVGEIIGLLVPDQGRRWFNINARPRFDESEVIGAVVTFSDITDRKLVEDELRESEARFRTLAESLPVGIYHAHASGDSVYVNPHWHAITETDHAIGSPGEMELVHPDDRERVLKMVAETSFSSETFHHQYRIVTPSGRVKWLNARGAPVIDEEGRTTGVVGSIEDISPLVEAQEETARLASIVESTSDMVCIIDFASGQMLYMNTAGRRMLGHESATLDATTVDDVFALDAALSLRETVFPGLADGEIWSGELAMRAEDGRLVQMWQNMVGHHDNEGRLQHVSLVGRDVTERRRAAEVLTHQATHDGLTDLPNRTLLLNELEDALAVARSDGGLVALLFLDLDRFKGVNDRLGHDAGDELLVEAARRISSVLRPGDLVARLGGDEFVVICRDVNDDGQATAIAQRITTTIESTPIVLGAHQLSITASVGVALSDGGLAHPESLLRDADAAMYRAKDLGRARLELFDESMRRRTMGRAEVAEELGTAIERGHIVVYFQPCISLTDGKVTCVEALARWDHPERGILLPKEFIDIAEETGQIVGLGLQVLTRSCQQGRIWEETLGADAPRIHVNLSARQLSASNIPDLVSGVLERSGLSPHKLCLEITESVLMEDAAVVIDTLWALKSLGITLAIDDFGTGYSSLSYLRKFPVDIIKVDQSFVDGLGPDPEDSAIVTAIIGLAHALELEAIAEGVETFEQLERLRELGCHNAQGFLFAKPQPAKDITPLLTVFSAAERLRQR